MDTGRSRHAICADLDELVQEPGFIYSLAAMLRHDLFLDPTEAADINWHDRLSFQEFTFLSGLLVKRPIDLSHAAEESVRSQVARAYQLFGDLHSEHESHWVKGLTAATEALDSESASYSDGSAELFGAGDTMTEPIFYSSSGAYDFQYWEFAPRRYRLDTDWLRDHKGIDIATAAEIIRAIKERPLPTLHTTRVDEIEVEDWLLQTFCVTPDDFPNFDRAQVDAFFAAFALEPGQVNEHLVTPGQYNQVASHPLIKLSDGRFFLPVYFNLPASLYESPFYWMLADDAYRDQSLQHRGDATEELVSDLLKGVFGGDSVHRGVKIHRGRHVAGEIDVLVVFGRKALIVQCKSKRLTELARTGDTESLKKDFKHAVQDAYDQGLACTRLLAADSGLRLESRGQTIEWPRIDETYIACVVSDHYPAITHQVHAYLSKRHDEPSPLALSVLDLDVVSFYLADPFEFLYYVRQRIALAETVRSDEEIALLAYHLRHKLYKDRGHDFVAVDPTMAQLIDANFPVAKGHVPKTDAADRLHHHWENEAFNALLAEVKASDVRKVVDAVFLLMDMAGDFADQLMNNIDKTKEKTLRDGKRHSLVMISDEADAGVTFVARGSDWRRLQADALSYAEARKYATKSTTWLGLGAMADSEKAADVVDFNNDPWSPDDRLEGLSRVAMRPGTQVNPKRKMGRNERCYCGSGLKYKHCHGRF